VESTQRKDPPVGRTRRFVAAATIGRLSSRIPAHHGDLDSVKTTLASDLVGACKECAPQACTPMLAGNNERDKLPNRAGDIEGVI